MNNDIIACYCYVDLVSGHRLHMWGSPAHSYAIGNGPLKDISKEEAMRMLKESYDAANRTNPARRR